MAAIMLQAIPSFYAKNSKQKFSISANTFENYIVSKDYCIVKKTRRVFDPLVNIILY